MTSPTLFSPITLDGLTFPNRIAVAPMCQYSADDGSATDWHLQHWMTLAMSGAGMVTIEATAVERRGRITHGCLGLYSDHNESAAQRTLAAARSVAPQSTRFGIQFAHAGRKARTQRPWEGGGPLGKHQDPWQTVAPSAVPHAPDWHDAGAPSTRRRSNGSSRPSSRPATGPCAPASTSSSCILRTATSAMSSCRRSPTSAPTAGAGRWRTACASPLTIAEAVRAALPASILVGARLSVTDWVGGRLQPGRGGGRRPGAQGRRASATSAARAAASTTPPRSRTRPSYQVPFAEKLRREAAIPTRAVGLIDDPLVAEAIVTEGKADIVALARAMLADPRWPWRAAVALGATLPPGPPVRPLHAAGHQVGARRLPQRRRLTARI